MAPEKVCSFIVLDLELAGDSLKATRHVSPEGPRFLLKWYPGGGSRRAPARSRLVAVKALSMSSARRASRTCSCSPNVRAAPLAWSTRVVWLNRFAGFQSTATRTILGKASLSSSSRFPLRSGAIVAIPVMLPPGLARLATWPVPTGSPCSPKTTGMEVVARLTAPVSGADDATMTSTLRRTNSAASSASRSDFPSA